MWNSAADAMIEALPAAIGMGIPGAVLSGGGNYAGLKRLTKEDWHAAREAFYRENEKEMTQTVIKERNQNKIFKTDPEIFAKKHRRSLIKKEWGPYMLTLQVRLKQKKEEQLGAGCNRRNRDSRTSRRCRERRNAAGTESRTVHAEDFRRIGGDPFKPCVL